MLADSLGRLNTIDPPPLSSRFYSFEFTSYIKYLAGNTVGTLAQASFGFGQGDRQIRYRMPPTHHLYNVSVTKDVKGVLIHKCSSA